MWEALRWGTCLVLGVPFGLFLIGNWLLLFGTARTRKPVSLLFPFCCGPACALGCLLSPSEFLHTWCWVPLVLDFTFLVLVGDIGRRGWSWIRGLLFRAFVRRRE
jgi:hypothetical protein